MSIRKTLSDILDTLRAIDANVRSISTQPSPSNVSEAMDILVRTARKSTAPLLLRYDPAAAIQRPTLESIGDADIRGTFQTAFGTNHPEKVEPEYPIGTPVWVRRKIGDALVNQPGKPGVVISVDTLRNNKRYKVATTTGLVTVGIDIWSTHPRERNVLDPRVVEVGEPVIVYRSGNPSEPGHDDVEGIGWIASVNREGQEWAVAWGWHRTWGQGAPESDMERRIRRMCSRYAGGMRARVNPRSGDHDRAPAVSPDMLDGFANFTNRWFGDDGPKIKRRKPEIRATEVCLVCPHQADDHELHHGGSVGACDVGNCSCTGFRSRPDGGDMVSVASATWYRLPGTDVEVATTSDQTLGLRYRTVTADAVPATVRGQDVEIADLPTEVYDALELLTRTGLRYGISVQMSNRVTSQPSPSFTIPPED